MKKSIGITTIILAGALSAVFLMASCKSKDNAGATGDRTQPPEPPMGMQDGMGKGMDGEPPKGMGKPGEPPDGMPEPPDGNGGPGMGMPGGFGPDGAGPGGPGQRNSTYIPECDDADAQAVTYAFKNAQGVTVTYHAKYVVDGKAAVYSAADFAGGKVAVSSANEIAFLVINGGSLTLNGVTIEKTGDGDEKALDGDAYNFYGINNAVVAVGEKSTAVLDGVTITTNALHANAVFATDGAAITVKNGINISNSKRGSRGFFASYGGSVTSNDGGVNISTKGNNSAALATDRGGGTITVLGKNNTLSTQANDSPCIYSTGTVVASGITGRAASAQAVVVEGLNNVKITDSTFTGARKGQGTIMIYQSFSGDSSNGDGNLEMENCIFYNQFADDGEALFYITNTNAVVSLKNVIFYAGLSEKSYSKGDVFALCEENDTQHWGKSGSNGGHLVLTADGETLTGTVKAAEKDSAIQITCGTSNLVKDKKSAGSVKVNGKKI